MRKTRRTGGEKCHCNKYLKKRLTKKGRPTMMTIMDEVNSVNGDLSAAVLPPSSSLGPNRVQHLGGCHLHLQLGLHDPGLALPCRLLHGGGPAEGLPPQTRRHVLRLCRYVLLSQLLEGSAHHQTSSCMNDEMIEKSNGGLFFVLHHYLSYCFMRHNRQD